MRDMIKGPVRNAGPVAGMIVVTKEEFVQQPARMGTVAEKRYVERKWMVLLHEVMGHVCKAHSDAATVMERSRSTRSDRGRW